MVGINLIELSRWVGSAKVTKTVLLISNALILQSASKAYVNATS
ncbi:hypothetical protein LINPERHAP1_LOCUS23673 [Linum perenne]